MTLLNYGAALLSAALSDLVAVARDSREPTMLVVHGVTRFPHGLFRFFCENLHLRAEAVELTVAGLCLPHNAQSWPRQRLHAQLAKRGGAGSERQNDSRVIASLSGRTRFDLRLLAFLVAIAGTNSAHILSDLLSIDMSDAESLARALSPLFNRDASLPLREQIRALATAVASDVQALKGATGAARFSLTQDRLVGMALGTVAFVLHGSDGPLDEWIVRHCRENGAMRELGGQLGRIADECAALGEPTLALLRAKEDVVIRIGESQYGHDAVFGFFSGLETRWKAAESIDPSLLSSLYYQLGYTYFVREDRTLSGVCVSYALVADPGNYQAKNLEGILLLTDNKRYQAASAFKKVTEIRSDYAFGHYNLAVVYEQAGDYEIAARSYVRAISLDHEFHEAIFNLSNVLIALECYEDAAIVSDIGVKNGALSKLEFTINLGVSLMAAGLADAGIALMIDADKGAPSFILRYNVVIGFLRLNEKDRAKHWLKRAREFEQGKAVANSLDQLARQIEGEGPISNLKGSTLKAARASEKMIDVLALQHALQRDGIEVGGYFHRRVTQTIEKVKSQHKSVNPPAGKGLETPSSKRGEARRRAKAIRTALRNSRPIRLPSYGGG